MGKRKLRPPPTRDLQFHHTDGTHIGDRTYGSDGRLKLHSRKFPGWKHSRYYRTIQRTPPIGPNEDRMNYIRASQIQNIYRIKSLLPKRLRQISNKKMASKIMARKTTRVLGDVVSSYL